MEIRTEKASLLQVVVIWIVTPLVLR